MTQEEESQKNQQPAHLLFEKEKRRLQSKVLKLKKSAEKYLKKCEKNLADCQDWQKIFHEGQLLQANLYRLQKGVSEISVSDWGFDGEERIIFVNPLSDPHEEVSKRFSRSKKLRSGEKHAVIQLLKAKEFLDLRTSQLEAVQKITSFEEIAPFCLLIGLNNSTSHFAPSVKKRIKKPYQIFLSKEKLEIWVGKNAKDNDKMTFQCAKGNDWWFHSRDGVGSHIILRVLRDKDPDAESIRDAAELAIRFSKFKEEKDAEVCFTHVKYLLRIKSNPGKVAFSKHKVLKINLEDERWHRLKENKFRN